MLRLTNAERADLIDALGTAMETNHSNIDGNTLGGVPATADDPEWILEMKDQIRRWRLLRRRYLKEEERVNQ